ncbi:MAG: carbohydrate ABC transporter permease, partial [Micromonosporaceae bacterium]
PGPRPRRRRRARPWNMRLAPYLFVLPNMLVFGLFTIWPAINGFNVSLYDSRNGRTFDYVGGRNYERIVSDPEFWAAVQHTVVFVVGFVLISTAFSIGLAALLDAQRRGRAFFRAAFFLPVLLSPVVVGLIWEWVLDRKIGLLNTLIAGLGGGQPGWLVNPTLALGATVWVGVWTHIGFYTLITLAGLQGIDPALHEAAQIDGAGTWQRFRLITLPLLRPTTMVVIILSTITGFQAFDFIYTLTGGGPIGATTLIVQYVYENAFESPIRYGLASAGAVLLFVTVLGVTLLNYLIGRRREAV